MINSISLTQVAHFYGAALDLFYNALDIQAVDLCCFYAVDLEAWETGPNRLSGIQRFFMGVGGLKHEDRCKVRYLRQSRRLENM